MGRREYCENKCASGGAESFEGRVPGREDGLKGFAFDLQRFADSEAVAVVKDGSKVTLTLPDLSGMRQYDTITLKDSAGTVYGTLTIPDSGDDTQAQLALYADSGVTHIDATNKNTRRSVNVLNAGKVVCTIKNGEDIGCFEIEDSDFFLEDTVPANSRCSLIEGVLTLPGYYTGEVTVAASASLTLRGLYNGEGYGGVLTIEPLAGGRAEGIFSGTANCFLNPQNASLEASAGCFLYQGDLGIKAGADGVKAKADGDGKVALTGGAAVLSGAGVVSVDAEAGATVAWDENQQTDSTRGTYTFAAGAKASMKCEGGYSYEEHKDVYTAATVLTEGKASLTEGLCLTIGETEYKAAQAGTTLECTEEKAKLTAGAVELDQNEKILVGETEYTASAGGTKVKLNDEGKAELAAGEVELDQGARILVGGTEYTANADGTKVKLNTQDKAELAAGVVALDKGETIIAGGREYTAAEGGANFALTEDCKGELTSGAAELKSGETVLSGGTEYTATETGATLSRKDNKTELTKGEVSLSEGRSIYAGGKEYKAAANGTKLALDDNNKAKLTAGVVALDKGETIIAGDREYTALEDDAAIALTDDGQVQLAEGTHAEVSGLGSIIIGKGTCEVDSDGPLTGLTDGTSLTLEQDGVEYEMKVSGGELAVTKDGVTKTTPLEEGTGINEDMLEELYPSDPSRPLTIKSAPGKTKRPENYDVSKDTIKLAKVSGTLDLDEIIITEDGRLTYGKTYAQGLAANGAIDLSEAEQGKDYYEARLTDKNGNNKQLAAWSGSDGAVLDKRSETKGVVMKDGGNGEKDIFYGGKGRDSITLGSENIARGGEGRDVIIIGADAKGAEVALQNGGGHDEVQGFGFGFDEAASIVNLEDSSGLASLSVDGSGRLKTEGSTLELVGTDLKNSNQADLLMRDAGGLHKVSMGTKMAQTGDEAADVYYGTGRNAELDFSSFSTDALTIDLNNNWGNTTADVYRVKKVTGADEAENILIGQDGRNNTIVGGDDGANSLYGGQGGNDTLIGSSTSQDSFYFGLGSGRDKIENFGEEDKLQFLDGNYAGAKMDSNGHLKFKWSDGQGNTASLTLDEDVRDKVITYDFGDGAHGAKFGSCLTITDDTADFVNFYSSGGKKGELALSGTDDKSIWLDGSRGAAYEGFRKVDASSMSGDAILAGGAGSEELIAGRGDASLWGGSGSSNDTLTGGRGENEFYFGKGEGKDVITYSNNDDKVMLYNVTLEDIDGSRTGVNKEGRMVIALNDGSALTIQNYKSHGAETFQLADSTWTYDKKTGSWAQVK